MKQHWENVYETKNPQEVSWTQSIPKTSLNFINNLNLTKTTSIIDVGGGDSTLVDYLLDAGYTNITVLDISEKALEKAKLRLKNRAHLVTWIISDILDFMPSTKYDVWHDRATFHFLTTSEQINSYRLLINSSINEFIIIGTFSLTGQKKCSGLDITQYSDETLTAQFNTSFKKEYCLNQKHTTPFATTQDFIFCVFKKKFRNV